MPYADIIVDLSNENVDKTFTYFAPEDMNVRVGDMVRVSFGKRTLEGFVLNLKPKSSLARERVKDIECVLSDEPALLPELIALAEWMRTRYNCNLVDALRLMLPAEMRGGKVKRKLINVAELTIPPEEALKLCARSEKQKKLIELLSTGAKPAPYLALVLDGAREALKALEKKGAVSITQSHERRAPDVSEDGRSKSDPVLMPHQQTAADELTQALASGGGRFLLYGVTGSGKTEVYIRLIRAALAMGKGAIVLVPEIALTPQTVSWFRARFGDDAAVIHSRLSAGERFDEWERARLGEARVVIGARSAVFAPVENLGAIIIDEEHENAYQSEKRPRYDAREVAWQRVEMARGVLVLGSATPSIATFMRASAGVKPENKLTLLELPYRVMGRPLPETQLVDMRRELELGNKGIFSYKLVSALKECIANGHQAMLFINRRGFSTFVSCRKCGHVEKCDECDVMLTYHIYDALMRCHYCGKTLPPPTTCPECGSEFIRFFGAGTQKVEDEVKKLLPDVPVLRMDVDTTHGKNAHAKILDAFRLGKARVLVGTQMIAKGLDFPNVTLVGVVAADTTLNLPDYRSVERTFQLITQVAGRAGRAEAPGKVIVQTYSPEHYGLKCALNQDYRAFYHLEAAYRRKSLYPPFTVIARLLVSAKDVKLAHKTAQTLEREFIEAATQRSLIDGVLVARALEAPIKRIRSLYRWQVYVKMYARGEVAKLTALMEEMAQAGKEGVKIELEVNPASMT